MQPLILLAIVGVAVGAMGMGFLAPGFDMNVQNLGAQEQDLVSPITTANVDFVLFKSHGFKPNSNKPILYNVIDQCSFHSPNSFGQAGNGFFAGARIICKLTDSQSDVVAEGKVILTSRGYVHSETIYIPITNLAVNNPPSNDVQNIFDVKIVVLGADPTPP